MIDFSLGKARNELFNEKVLNNENFPYKIGGLKPFNPTLTQLQGLHLKFQVFIFVARGAEKLSRLGLKATSLKVVKLPNIQPGQMSSDFIAPHYQIFFFSGDLDRIKSTSFFKRIPPPSEVKKQEEQAQAEEEKRQEPTEEQKVIAAAEAAIVPVSESESEEEDEDDIFDTTYIDAIAAGEVKLAYIPESPTDQPDGDDPFDTSYAEKAILGPAVSRKGKKLVPIGAAVEILTGRVQAPTCVPTKRPTSRRQILQQRDLLLGSFDDSTNEPSDVPKGNKRFLISHYQRSFS